MKSEYELIKRLEIPLIQKMLNSLDLKKVEDDYNFCDPAGTRTLNPKLKRLLLYH